jgi:carboxylate-amine ligase
VKIFETFPRAGMPPAFPGYEAFEGYVDLMVEAGAMEDYTFCWWDVRPHPSIGTIELRIPDTQTSLKYAVALTALTQCIVARSLEETGPQGPYNRELGIENKMRAARHGMDATFYDAAEKTTVSARDLARTLVEQLRPISQDLNCENELSGVLEIVEGGTGSRHQHQAYDESGDFLDVVAFLIEGTRPALAEEQS